MVLADVIAAVQSPLKNRVDAQRVVRVLAAVMQAKDLVGTGHEPAALDELLRWSPDVVKAWRDEFYVFLLMNVARTPDQPSPIVTLNQIKIAVHIDRGQRISFAAYGSAHDVLAFQILGLFRAAGASRLRRCECGRVFVKVHKRSYCSTRCQKRFYMRRLRAGEAGKE